MSYYGRANGHRQLRSDCGSRHLTEPIWRPRRVHSWLLARLLKEIALIHIEIARVSQTIDQFVECVAAFSGRDTIKYL